MLSNINKFNSLQKMKIFTNLPSTLHILFNCLRILTMVMAVFWTLTLAYNTWIQKHLGYDTKLIATVGEISLPNTQGFGLGSDTASPGSLVLQSLRGTLQADLASRDPALTSTLRQAIIPPMAILIIFSYILFTALRNVCGNLARGRVFTEENLRLIRRIGANLIAYCLISAGLEIWASHVLSSYFSQHVVLTGLQTSVSFANGSAPLQFQVSAGLITAQGGILIGCLVLVVAEAFRQGLNLKTENDLTV
jgi:hypothetical protein